MEQTGRQRATRIALDYHRQRDDLWRRRMIVAGAALVLALGYVAYGQFAPQGQLTFAHGPLARVHARWDADCQACHDDFQAIHSRAWFANDASVEAMQRNCTTCHAGTTHNRSRIRDATDERQACSKCHREHRGRNIELVRVADDACTTCHAQIDVIQAPAADTTQFVAESVAAFAAGKHPDFRSLRDDPGNVRFNHALHLLPGIRAPDSRDPGMTNADIMDKYPEDPRRTRALIENASDPVQLYCSDCHSLPRVTNQHAKGERARMQPVTYDAHCKACHVLDYTAGDKSQVVKHGITLYEIREDFAEAKSADTESGDAQDALEIDATMEHLQRKCAKCHEPAQVAGPEHQVVLPPRNWFRHARFNHAAHTGATCTTCHLQSTTVAEGGAVALLDGGTDQDRVMIKGIGACLQCHEKSDQETSIARSDCVECHRYHTDPIWDPDYGWSTSRLHEPLLPKSDGE